MKTEKLYLEVKWITISSSARCPCEGCLADSDYLLCREINHLCSEDDIQYNLVPASNFLIRKES